MTQPDITETIVILCRYVEKQRQKDWNAVKRVLRYLKETQNINLRIIATDLKLTGYVDADWAGDLSDCKSTSGYLFKLGESSISWPSRKQVSVTLSITEEKYVSAAHSSQEVIWLNQLLGNLGKSSTKPTVIYEDN
ncbi:uncharacterized protein [Phyllobates terribilis]|uniref:uncharacterized protein n=1 Tax=Phyllobates terribilis TaxID=111132 RepID=UPI003CCB70C7